MKNKVIKITLIIAMIIVMLAPSTTFAITLASELEKVEIRVVTDKNSYNIGEKVKATVKWEKEAESLGFKIDYDEEKLEFESISLGKNYYNVDTPGRILCNWFSTDGSGKNNIEIVFKSKIKGQARINVNSAKGFAWVSDTIDKGQKEYIYIDGVFDIKFEKLLYEGLDDYFKESFIQYNEKNGIFETITNIDYENLDKTQITELNIWSIMIDENNKILPLSINNFEELYKYTNLKVLRLNNLENIEKIDFTRLPNLKEIYIYDECTLQGRINFNNLNLEHIYINLKCDLSKAIIEVDEELWENGLLNYMDLTLDSSLTEDFGMEKVFPGATKYMGNVRGNVWEIFAANGIGGMYKWDIDTLNNYMKLYYPNNTKEEIKELDLYNNYVEDISLIGEFENLEKLIIREEVFEDGIQENRKLDLRNFENLKVLKYVYSMLDGDKIIRPILGDDIIVNDESKIKHKIFDEYSGMYYFGVDYNNLSKEGNSLKVKEIDGINVITNIKENETIGEVKKEFDSKYRVYINSFEYEEVENSDTVATGMRVQVFDEDDIYIGEHILVMYGDTDGDAEITAKDALTLIKILNEKIEPESQAHVEAGKISGEAELTPADALRIIKHLNKKYEISQDI